MNREARRALITVFSDAYDPSSLRRFVRNYLPPQIDGELPSGAGKSDLIDILVSKLDSFGLVGAELWESLEDDRPHRADQIREVRATVEAALAAGAAPLPVPVEAPFSGWLTHPELIKLVQAHQAAGLMKHDQLDALQGGLDANWAGTLDTSGPPNLRLLKTLQALNGVKELANGKVPLKSWLELAMILVFDANSQAAFQTVLDRIG